MMVADHGEVRERIVQLARVVFRRLGDSPATVVRSFTLCGCESYPFGNPICFDAVLGVTVFGRSMICSSPISGKNIEREASRFANAWLLDIVNIGSRPSLDDAKRIWMICP
jgi:hypothetical protein